MLEFTPYKNGYRVDKSILFENGCYVPKGFIFDGASIPRLAWSVLGVTPFDPRIIEQACWHDWIYYTHEFSRLTIDNLFRKETEKKIGKFTAFIMYHAIRKFGGSHWENTESDKNMIKAVLANDE